MCLVSFSKTKSYGSRTKMETFKGSPLWGYVEITNSCSHKCAWCYGEFHLDNKHMSLETFKTVSKKLKEIGIIQLTLAGGEPTEHPDFLEILNLASRNFDYVNIVTHGAWNEGVANAIAEHKVNQVQFNFQGKKFHNKIHGVPKCYEKQIESIKAMQKNNIHVVTNVTFGDYNIKHINQIFKELIELEVDRIRVWETTGVGSKFLSKNKDIRKLFEKCRDLLISSEYRHIHSYEPEFDEGIWIPCPAASNLTLYIKYDGSLIYCSVVSHLRNDSISDFLEDEPDEILRKHNKYIENKSNKTCLAREK